MSIATLHADVQRSRFIHHTLAALAGLIPALLRVTAPAPVPSAAESAAREAQAVRELAQSYAKTDPGFSSDLYAAAARHESLHEG